MVKSTYCSYKGPGLGAQYPCGSSQPSICNSSFRISFLTSAGYCEYTHAHKINSKMDVKGLGHKNFYIVFLSPTFSLASLSPPSALFLETGSFSVVQVSLELTF